MTLESADEPALFAVDWGTSTLRAWALDARGGVLASARSGAGMLAVVRTLADDVDPDKRADAFAAALTDLAGTAMRAWPRTPILACGMIGAATGWREADYLPVPVELSSDALTLTRADYLGRDLWIVPGLQQTVSPRHPYPDVMRGEETQVLGASAALGPDADVTVVLPGTHSKWVHVRSGVVQSFQTVMTGELFSAVMEDTILGQPARDGAGFDERAFAWGAQLARQRDASTPLAGLLFSARTLHMSGELAAGSIGDFASGLLIGDEVAHLLAARSPAADIVLCGGPDICDRYLRALTAAGATARVVGEDATIAGLWAIARATGLVGEAPVTTPMRGEVR